MTMTLADVRAQCRLFLTSATDWTDAMLVGWINDGIRAYSNDFPRRLRHTLALSTETQAYDLPGDHGFVRLLDVEYPAGESPPIYLDYVTYSDPAFSSGESVYTLLAPEDDIDPDFDTVMGELVFAQTVVSGETARLIYAAVHSAVMADDDVLTVPETHMEAVISFVDFRAHWEAESDEAYSASSSTLVLSQLGENGRRAWNRWREVMKRLGPVGGWRAANPSWPNIGL